MCVSCLFWLLITAPYFLLWRIYVWESMSLKITGGLELLFFSVACAAPPDALETLPSLEQVRLCVQDEPGEVESQLTVGRGSSRPPTWHTPGEWSLPLCPLGFNRKSECSQTSDALRAELASVLHTLLHCPTSPLIRRGKIPC